MSWLKDKWLEMKIRFHGKQIVIEKNKGNEKGAYIALDRMEELMSQRSPEQIARMEKRLRRAL